MGDFFLHNPAKLTKIGQNVQNTFTGSPEMEISNSVSLSPEGESLPTLPSYQQCTRKYFY